MRQRQFARAHWRALATGLLVGISLFIGEIFAAPAPKPQGRAPDPAQRCIELAAAWRDKGPGIEFDDIDPRKAIPACQAAVQAHSDQADLQAHLCRALNKAQRYDEAIGLCRQAAEAGSAAGQNLMGWSYQHGEGVPQSATEAVAWYRKAAGQGFWYGYFNLGILLIDSRQAKEALEPLQQALILAQKVGYRRGEALVLHNLGGAYRGLDLYPEALEHYQQALAIYQKLGNRKVESRKLEGSVLWNLGYVYQHLARYPEALEHYKQALAIYRKLGDRKVERDILTSLGFAYGKLDQHQKALDYHQKALTIAQALGEKSSVAEGYSNVCYRYIALERYLEAIEFCKQAISLHQELKDLPAKGRDLGNLGEAFSGLERYPEAISYYQQAIEIARELGDKQKEAMRLSKLGDIYSDLDHAKAISYYQQALVIHRELNDRQGEATDLADLGNVYFDFDHAKAISYYQQALVIHNELGDLRGATEDRRDLADSYKVLGRYREAIETLQQALAGAQQLADQSLEAEIKGSLNAVRLLLGQPLSVLTDLEQPSNSVPDKTIDLSALAGAHFLAAQHPSSPEEGRKEFKKGLEYLDKAVEMYRGQEGVEFELGQSYFLKGDFGEAKRHLALAISREEVNSLGSVVALSMIGLIDAQEKQYSSAIDHLTQALDMASLIQAPEAIWLSWFGFVMVFSEQERFEAAIFAGKQAVNTIQRMRQLNPGLDKTLQRSFLSSREAVYRSLADLLIGRGRLVEAEQVLAMFKEEELYDFLRRRGADPRTTQAACNAVERPWCERYQAIQDRLVGLGREYYALKERRGQGPLEPAEQARFETLEADLNAGRQAFRTFWKELLPALQAEQRPQVLDQQMIQDSRKLQRALEELGHGAVALHYLVTEERLHILLTTPQVQLARESPVRAVELRQSLLALREQLKDPHRDPLPLARKLYGWLITPVLDDLKQAEAHTLMVSLDDVLRYLPLAALHDGQRYLVEDYALAVYTAAAGLDLKDRPADQWRAAGLGVSQAIGSHPALPAVPGELRAIVRTNKGDSIGVLPGEIALNQDFTRSRLERSLATRYPVMHLSSHFVFRPGHIEDSYLLLGDGSTLNLETMRDQEDRFDFRAVELLTLSACETAMGEKAKGIEIESFGALAQKQGAKGVIASLWPVADASTGQLMQRFYAGREAGKLTKAEALRRAQLALLRGESLGPRGTIRGQPVDLGGPEVQTISPYSHPYYWAPFILMGNWL